VSDRHSFAIMLLTGHIKGSTKVVLKPSSHVAASARIHTLISWIILLSLSTFLGITFAFFTSNIFCHAPASVAYLASYFGAYRIRAASEQSKAINAEKKRLQEIEGAEGLIGLGCYRERKSSREVIHSRYVHHS
jgi:hypothetical protein